MPLDAELVTAGAHRHLGCHDFEHVVHHREQVGLFGRERLRQTLVDKILQFGQRQRCGAVVLQGMDARLQGNDQRVVALQPAPHVGQLLCLVEEPLREHLLAGQQAFAQALAEGLVADVGHPLQQAGFFQLHAGIEPQQLVGGHQTLGQHHRARAHLLLQRAPRHSHELGGAPDGQPVAHNWSSGWAACRAWQWGVGAAPTRSR
ncbi:hypothetical protein FQZ97_1025550 [compost metagenome]